MCGLLLKRLCNEWCACTTIITHNSLCWRHSVYTRSHNHFNSNLFHAISQALQSSRRIACVTQPSLSDRYALIILYNTDDGLKTWKKNTAHTRALTLTSINKIKYRKKKLHAKNEYQLNYVCSKSMNLLLKFLSVMYVQEWIIITQMCGFGGRFTTNYNLSHLISHFAKNK